MKLFRCQACGQILYFENTVCERCRHVLGYRADIGRLCALEPEGEAFRTLGHAGQWRFCENATHEACNWLVPAESDSRFCQACSHNHLVPDLTVPANLPPWRLIEVAKRRLMYSLLRLKLPVPTRAEDPETGLAFDILADPPVTGGPKVMTGHDNGLITIALAEADDAEREQRRAAMGEPYRTLLGHFRHESGHYYWDRLVRDAGRLEACRAMFGDETADYGAALQMHYANGAPADWQENFVSSYATSHPWEDFAETWAHYLHIVDTLEMAAAFGISLQPQLDRRDEMSAEIDFDSYAAPDIETLMAAWLPLTSAMNALSRSIGARDLYPFILSPAVIAKLGFIHALVREALPVSDKLPAAAQVTS